MCHSVVHMPGMGVGGVKWDLQASGSTTQNTLFYDKVFLWQSKVDWTKTGLIYHRFEHHSFETSLWLLRPTMTKIEQLIQITLMHSHTLTYNWSACKLILYFRLKGHCIRARRKVSSARTFWQFYVLAKFAVMAHCASAHGIAAFCLR